jgi:Fur family ferric uptake transcriptional regulator
MAIRLTPQRQAILNIINSSPCHWDAESILQALRHNEQKIGIATVYRGLTALESAGMIDVMFMDQRKCYERINKQHHDHLLCCNCGRIEEFTIPELQSLQQSIAQAHGFTLHSHSLIIKGLCQQCQK